MNVGQGHCNRPTDTEPAQQYPGGTITSEIRALDGIQTPTNQAVSPVEGGDFKSLLGRIGGGRRAAAAPARKTHWEAVQERRAADTAATNDVPFEMAPTEKTPGPVEGMR
ncbi:hypothetical protein NDU88_004416 [Pleurodeles waltl]|uniref:Uncharacterized protein n=1 Tax=Pleurodeles waltl TaxID=8319 RepID=A0AAV7RGV4_PLEWA|nr:hypothetical protein NDU88_004416 [Pleurodeles waltl]